MSLAWSNLPWYPLLLAYARLAPVCLFLPFFGRQVTGGLLLKNSVLLLMALGLSPLLAGSQPNGLIELLQLLLLESVTGLLLGLLFGMPFWLADGLGCLIDNQRGAGLAALLSPYTNSDSLLLGQCLQLFYASLFLQAGGLVQLLEAMRYSYFLLPVGGGVHWRPEWAGALADHLLWWVLLLAAPVWISLLLIDLAVGLLSRFAPQLNAFSMALALKSVLALLLLMLICLPTMQPASRHGRWWPDLAAVLARSGLGEAANGQQN